MIGRDKPLLVTPMGSRLYGLSHADSDYDYWTVIDKVKSKRAKYNKHSIVGDQDNTVIDFGTWIDQCQAGVPQALEAMFSRMATTDRIASYRSNFKAGTDYSKYLGIMKNMSIEHPDSFKHKRHILRLALNMRSLRESNRFNPTLNHLQIELINSLAKLDMTHVYNDAMALARS
jgi:hypothetical protein